MQYWIYDRHDRNIRYMNVLWVSPEGLGTACAIKMVQSGHAVRWVTSKNFRAHGLLTDNASDWKPHVAWADILIFDDCINDDVDVARALHVSKPIVGGNTILHKLENDRFTGKRIFKKLGLTISDCAKFTSFDTAIRWIREHPGRWVFKANGQASRTLGYVGEREDGSDVIERIEFYASSDPKKHWDKKMGVSFTLERYVSGIEVACGAYWDGSAFSGINVNFEHKKRSVGNLGIATGEMGTTVSKLSRESRLFAHTLAKLVPILRAKPYNSYVDLNCIATAHALYVLEVTARFGSPIEECLAYLRRQPIDKFYIGLGSGKLAADASALSDNWGIVFVVTTFGWPYETAYEEMGGGQPFHIPIAPGIYLMEADLIKGRLITSTKGQGSTLFVTASAPTVTEAKRKALAIINKIQLPGKDYRLDIGDKTMEHMQQLKDWKWI